MSPSTVLSAVPPRRVRRALILGLVGAKLFTCVPVGAWESGALGPAAGVGLDLLFVLCLTGFATLFGWPRASAWRGGALAAASFSLCTPAALLLWRIGHEPVDALDLWLRWFRLSALATGAVGMVAAFGSPVVLRAEA